MKFKVKDIGEDGIDVDLAITPAWLAQQCADLELRPDPDSGKRFGFRGRIEVTADDYLLRGKLNGGLLVPCARCLEPAKLPLDVDVSVVYVEHEDNKAEDDDDIDAPDVLTFEDGTIDLSPELRDEILLAVPVSVLCREDCAGLCSVCGNNRNLTPCDCVERQQQSQSKFAVLAKLKS
jgi:uncharacterized metal-binding protein YceD (DUF177 family)